MVICEIGLRDWELIGTLLKRLNVEVTFPNNLELINYDISLHHKFAENPQLI